LNRVFDLVAAFSGVFADGQGARGQIWSVAHSRKTLWFTGPFTQAPSDKPAAKLLTIRGPEVDLQPQISERNRSKKLTGLRG
jgi:hypothetical protein